MPEAQYYALLARALPGATWRELRWSVSRVWGWSLIHAAGILDGTAYIWPDPRLSSAGREMLRVQALQDSFARGEWRPQVDL